MLITTINKLNKGHERTLKARKNVFSSLITRGGTVLTNLVLVPLTINYINPQHYGVWLTLSSIIAWFSFFDIGFGHGLRNNLTEAITKGNHLLCKQYVSTTYAILFVIILIMWSVFFYSYSLLNWSKILNVTPILEPELSKTALICFTFFCISFVLKLLNTVLTANQQSAKASVFDFLSNVLILIIIYIASKISLNGSIVTLATITGFVQFAVLLFASMWFYTGELKQYKPSIKYIKFEYAHLLMGIGVKFFIIQMAGVFIFQTTNIVISQLLGPSEVTVYNVVFKYFSVITMLCGIISAPFWSAYTEAYIKEDFKWMKKIQNQLNILWIFLCAITLLLLIASKYLYKIWVGNNVDIPYILSVAMAINIIATSRWNLIITIINGTGKVKFQLLINVVLSIFFIPLSILLGKQFDLLGVILSNVCINVVYAILIPIQSNKILNKENTWIWNQ